MLFNSIDFAIFMPIVFFIYWALANNKKYQNLFLLFASYFFYAWWDWRYLSLVLLCTATNFSAGLLLRKTDIHKYRKLILIVCCSISLGVLGLFKYYNFFVTSFNDMFSLWGTKLNLHTLHLILPVGISFYTFHTLSYTIDVYRGNFQPTKDIISFSLFVSIFPLAMAGPIERATNLLPQIYTKRTFDYSLATNGMRQILWGLFKKIVVADNCAIYANQVFDTYQDQTASTLLLGAVLFAFQIYGDFSGYSDMALGIGKLLGFKFLKNFNFPYFSRDIAEFWRRWHISLTTWFRDYLYIPLGGSRVNKWKIIRNTFIIFLVSGFWHGANWTFIVWGAYHAILFLPLIVLGKNRKYISIVAEGRYLPSFKEIIQIGSTFLLVVFGWIFFRSATISDAAQYIALIFNSSFFSTPEIIKSAYFIPVPIMILVMLFIEWYNRDKQYGLEISFLNKYFRWIIYFSLLILIFIFGRQTETFIYFQF